MYPFFREMWTPIRQTERKNMKTYDVAVYKHINGKWIPKYTVTQLDYEEMLDSPFVQFVLTFTNKQWAELHRRAMREKKRLSELLDEQMKQNQ